MTKRVLFAGDSITRGNLGIGYLPLLAERFPDYELVNLGQDGDTLFGIQNRTLRHLKETGGYDLVVIAAGHNDIILSSFLRQSRIRRSIARRLVKNGSVPAPDCDSFVSRYRSFLESVGSIADSQIVMTTMSCINEDPASGTAQQRHRYNCGIRALSEQTDVPIADVGRAFDRALEERSCRDYCMKNLLSLRTFDKWRSKTHGRVDMLSRSRHLNLTIDGVHLNSRGAEIYANTIAPFLDRL